MDWECVVSSGASSLSGSLWVAWIHTYLLKGVAFWEVKVITTGSWMWRKLLSMWDLVYSFIRYDLINGETAFFWFDDWLQQGKLIETLGDVGTQLFGVHRNAHVVEATDGISWRLR